MFKTRINYTEKDNGYSIYDLVADDNRLDQVVRGAMRHLRRDSFYTHALSAIKHSKKYAVVEVGSGVEWMEAFFDNPAIFRGQDFLLEQIKIREGANSGYFQLEQDDVLQLTREQVEEWRDKMSYRHHSTFDIDDMPDDKVYAIRIYKKGRKVFPAAFKSFRIGYIQPAVNFPPMTAKYLYERFTEDIKDQEVINIYDPSAGWGGRILGAMGVRDDRRIHYVGTDPNPDNFLDDGAYSKYASIADFYNTKTYRGNPFFSETNSYEIFQEGSEEIGKHPDFQKYKGKMDLIFTSPPYFNREAYSEDTRQSYKKYGSSYESWKNGFLRPTLETCVEYLKRDRYLLWNVADLLIGGKYMSLQQDSIDILENLDMMYVYTIKMGLEGMPGQNRMGENGIPTCKNYCMVDGKYLKYEPIFVFKKS
ncbi:TPA: site-specific DNA-methyltransferase [Candidatus Woesearchaeota archaeon]|nr:site-specific DNA-methyltransferase [Candidatus Woesearchaeota archaeon]